MAKRKPKASEGEAKERPQMSEDAKLLQRIHNRFKLMVDADQENRDKALEDLRFVNEPGAQWDDNMKKERGNRPCYEFNKLRINGKRVINEIRANRPQGKVRAVEGGDKKTAELYEGLCRNIANISDFDTITDNAAEYQVDAGMGAWRIVTEYSDDDVFDQDLLIKPIKNPFCLYADPSCQDIMKRDAEDWILTEKISKSAFDARYPDAEATDFGDVEFDDKDDWDDGESVRIAEYWYKEPYEKEIWLVAFPQEDGSTKRITVDSTSDEGQAIAAQIKETPALAQMIERKRTAKCHRIMMCIAGGGDKLLEKPAVQAGSTHRFVMVHGESKVIDGKLVWWGLHRFSKDAQQSYNVSRTAIDETIAQAPKSKWWATKEQAQGNVALWAKAHQENLPFMLYNADAKAPGAPQRMPGADVPIALMHQAELSSDDIRATSGLHEESFAEESSAKSGIAIARKQNQAAIITYNFPDNMAKGIRRTWEILIDLIPHIYDAERELRVIGADGAEDYEKVNQIVMDPASGKSIRVNDLSVGKYDVTVTTGPSFSTLRQEATEMYGEFVQKFPEMMGVAGDLIFKASDLPYSEEIAKRLQTLLPPQIQQQMAEGKDIPPEAQAVMAQANQAMQQVQEQTQLVQQAAQEVEQSKGEALQAKVGVTTEIAKLDVKQARFDADVATKLAQIKGAMADLAIKEAGIGVKESGVQQREVEVDKREKEYPVKSQIEGIDKRLADFDALVASAFEGLGQRVQSIDGEVRKPKPKLRSISTKREGGASIAEALMDDGSTKRLRMERKNGGMTAVPIDDAAPTGIQ